MTNEPFRHRLSVRYFETDQMAVVYYSHYLVWFEAARTDYLKSRGFPYARLEELGYFLPVSEAYCKYAAPARYEDIIIVETRIKELRSASMRIDYRVLREKDEKLLATGYTVHPCINMERRVVRFPEILLKALS